LLKGYADEHVPHPLVLALRARGMDVVTVQERARRAAADADLLTEALSEERAMLTCDADFLDLAAKLAHSQLEFAPIFYWPQQQRTLQELLHGVLREAVRLDFSQACSQVFFL
jgi:Domain of unknown function (DUF5615)